MRRLPFSIHILERSLADWVGKVGLDTAAEHLRRHFGVPRCFELLRSVWPWLQPRPAGPLSVRELADVAIEQLHHDRNYNYRHLDRTAVTLLAFLHAASCLTGEQQRATCALWQSRMVCPLPQLPSPPPPPPLPPPPPPPPQSPAVWQSQAVAPTSDISSESGAESDDECLVVANARARSGPEMRADRAALRALHPSRMDFERELLDALGAPSCIAPTPQSVPTRLPPPHPTHWRGPSCAGH
jgi:hypothetical protein